MHFTIKRAKQTLAAFGCTLSKKDGEYKVRIKGSRSGQGYYTDDIADAVITGKAMGVHGRHGT